MSSEIIREAEPRNEKQTLYAIPIMVETQKEPLEKYCFGSCGKISMGGAIDLGDLGPCMVCVEKDCPHERGHTEIIGNSEMTGDPVCVRGLEPYNPTKGDGNERPDGEKD